MYAFSTLEDEARHVERFASDFSAAKAFCYFESGAQEVELCRRMKQESQNRNRAVQG